MQWVKGTDHSAANDQRVTYSHPCSYTVYKNGTTYYAEANFVGGTDYSDAVFSTLLNSYVIPALTDGGLIFIKAGTYSVTAAIDVTHKITVEGEGDATLLEASGDFAVLSFVGTALDLVSDVRAANLKILGSGKANTSCYGVKIEFGDRVTLENLHIRKCYAGIYIKGCHGLFIDDFKIAGTGVEQCEYGIQSAWQSATNMLDCTISNGIVGDTASTGMKIQGTSGFLAENVVVVNAAGDAWLFGDEGAGEYSEYIHLVNCHGDSPSANTDAGFVFKIGSADKCRGIQMDNCWAGGVEIGIYIWGATEVAINNFQGRDCVEDMIYVDGNHVNITGGLIIDWDNADASTYNGVELNGCSDCTVEGVTFKNANAGNDSIEEVGAADYNNIIGNNVRGATGITVLGSNTRCKANIGYVTENGGITGAIATATAVAHGLAATPTKVIVTAAETGPTDIFVTAVGVANFTINFGGGGNKTFYWLAEV